MENLGKGEEERAKRSLYKDDIFFNLKPLSSFLLCPY